MNRIILASQSPRRRELLQRIIPEFEIIPAHGEERSSAADPQDYVRELAIHKAREVMQRILSQQNPAAPNVIPMPLQEDGSRSCDADASAAVGERADARDTIYVIGSDTIVVCDGEIMGKPHDRADAYRMIHALQGHHHEVMTGVCVLRSTAGAGSKRADDDAASHAASDDPCGCKTGTDMCGDEITMDAFTCITKVHVASMTDAEIWHYLATGEADDKAGAYGIQGAFSLYVTGIEGSYSNVVGLPVAALYQSLGRMGLHMQD